MKKDANYFKINKVSVIGIGAVVLLMLYNLIHLGINAVVAYSNQTTTLFTTVSAGILDIVSASSSNSFTGTSVLFSSQSATANLGAFRVSDARGSGAGWGVNLAGNDWTAGTGIMQLDYNGTGATGNLGQMCLIATSGAISALSGGQGTTSITKGNTDCFGNASPIDIYTAATSFGKGDYWVTDFTLSQYIPSNPTAQNLTTTIVLTVS